MTCRCGSKTCVYCSRHLAGLQEINKTNLDKPKTVDEAFAAEFSEADMKRFDDLVEADQKTNMNKYDKFYRADCPRCDDQILLTMDVYTVLQAFQVENPAVAHAIKKLLAAGNRGYKDTVQDLEEAIVSINRGIELEGLK